jgi:hypothetical protein
MFGMYDQTGEFSSLIIVITLIKTQRACSDNFAVFFQQDAAGVVAADGSRYTEVPSNPSGKSLQSKI